MKKIFIITLLCLISIGGFAQIMMGESISAVRSMYFQNPDLSGKTEGYTKSGSFYIAAQNKLGDAVAWGFINGKVVVYTIIVSDEDPDAIRSYMKIMDERYVKTGPLSYTDYTGTQILYWDIEYSHNSWGITAHL